MDIRISDLTIVMPFQRQSIEQSELSVYLRKLREEKGISQEFAGTASGVSVKYLKAMEDGDWNKLPGSVYAKNFLKIYLNFLGGDLEKGMELFKVVDFSPKRKKENFNNSAPRVIFTPRRIEIALIIIALLGVAGYFIYEARYLSAKPALEIFYPPDNEQISVKIITIDGRAGSEAKVFINHEEVFVSPGGAFKETIDLQKGLNMITIQAVNKKGRTTDVERRVLVQE